MLRLLLDDSVILSMRLIFNFCLFLVMANTSAWSWERLTPPNRPSKMDALAGISPINGTDKDPMLVIGCKGDISRNIGIGVLPPVGGGWIASVEAKYKHFHIRLEESTFIGLSLPILSFDNRSSWGTFDFLHINTPPLVEAYLRALNDTGELVVKRAGAYVFDHVRLQKQLPFSITPAPEWELAFSIPEVKQALNYVLENCPTKTFDDLIQQEKSKQHTSFRTTPVEITHVGFKEVREDYRTVEVVLVEAIGGFSNGEQRAKATGVILRELSKRLEVDSLTVTLMTAGLPFPHSRTTVSRGIFLKSGFTNDNQFSLNATSATIAQGYYQHLQSLFASAWEYYEPTVFPHDETKTAHWTVKDDAPEEYKAFRRGAR